MFLGGTLPSQRLGSRRVELREPGAREILDRLQSLLPFLTPRLVVSEKTEQQMFLRLLIYSSFT